jgi:hypothetical protein
MRKERVRILVVLAKPHHRSPLHRFYNPCTAHWRTRPSARAAALPQPTRYPPGVPPRATQQRSSGRDAERTAATGKTQGWRQAQMPRHPRATSSSGAPDSIRNCGAVHSCQPWNRSTRPAARRRPARRGRRPRVGGDGGDGGAAEHPLIHPFPGTESRDPAQSVGLVEPSAATPRPPPVDDAPRLTL